MPPVILARLRPGLVGNFQLTVHAFPADQHDTNGQRTAICGFAAHGTLLEIVDGIVGMGCEWCMVTVAANGLTGGHTTVPLPPAPAPDSRGEPYAIGLRGELIWHAIATNPVQTRFEGRDAVLTACGAIGFLAKGTPPTAYKPCPTCKPAATRRTT